MTTRSAVKAHVRSRVKVIFKTLEEPQGAQTTRPGDLPESRATSAGRVNICSEVHRHTSGSLSSALSKWLTHLSLFFEPALLFATQDRQKVTFVAHFHP